ESGNSDRCREHGCADDHHATGQPDGLIRPDRHFRGYRYRYSSTQLSMAEERRKHQRGYVVQLYHAHTRQYRTRLPVLRGGEQLLGERNEQRGVPYGEPSGGGEQNTGSPSYYSTTPITSSSGWSICYLHCHRFKRPVPQLLVH